MNGKPDKPVLDQLVQQTAIYFREREEAVLALWARATKSAERR